MNADSKALAVVVTASLIALTGCSRIKSFFEKPEDEAEPKQFSITDTDTLVDADALPSEKEAQMVRADFNMDNLEDIAVTEKDEKGRSVVSVYLQKAGDKLRAQYFKAGGIFQRGDYEISALMSAKGQDYTDLMAIMKYPDGSKEMVHYRSDGKQFTEVMRKAMTPAPASAP